MIQKWLLEKNWRNFDLFIIVILFLMAVFSVSVIQSATSAEDGGLSYYAKRQILWVCVSLVVMVAALLIDHRKYEQFAVVFYGIGMVLLLYVEVKGYASGGAQRWIDFGSFRMQPSEYMKICVILMLAKELTKYNGEITRFRDLWRSFVIVGVPALLILTEPNLGTALVLVGIMMCMFLVAGVHWRIFLILFLIAFIVIATLVFLYYVEPDIFFKLIREYQLKRIISFMDPQADPLGSGFQVTQSLIAIGSGQLTGKGLSGGSQTKGGWVPEHHTDFIFAVVGEEFGFIGVSMLVCLFFLLIYRFLLISGNSADLFGSYVVAGVIGIIVFQVFQNIGMNLGMMPITGLPLPFISYGGSSLLSMYLCVGIILSVGISKKPSLFS